MDLAGRRALALLGLSDGTEPFANDLELYWKTGKGAARIRWGTPGDWTRCHRELNKHVGDERAKRICAKWHHDVTGQWPGEVKGKNPVGPG